MKNVAMSMVIVGMVLLAGSALMVLKWYEARTWLNPDAPKGKDLTLDERNEYAAMEQDGFDTAFTCVWLAVVVLAGAALLRFWPW